MPQGYRNRHTITHEMGGFDAYAEVRALMPISARLAVIGLHAAITIGLSWVLARLLVWLSARALRGLPEEPWTERARVLFPYRRGLTLLSAAAPISIVYGKVMAVGPLGALNGWATAGIALLAYLAVVAEAARADHFYLGQAPGLRLRLKSLALYWCLFLSPFLVGIPLAILLPAHLEGAALYWAIAGLVGVFAAPLFGGFLLARLLGLLPRAGERLSRIAHEVARRTHTELRGVYECDATFANAFALTSLRRMLFTRPALAILDDKEVDAICAHEMAHLKESRLVLLGRLVGLVVFLPVFFWRPLLHHLGSWGWAGCFLAGLLLTVVIRRIARRMEERADEHARDSVVDPEVYARALEKIHAATLTPAVLGGKGGTHGHLYDRLQAAGATPGFDRPKAPMRGVTLLLPLVMMFLMLMLPCFWPNLVAERLVTPDSGEGRLWFRLALTGYDDDAAFQLGLAREQALGMEEAASLYAAAARLHGGSPRHTAHLARVLAYLDRIPEAEEALQQTRERMQHWGDDETLAVLVQSAEELIRARR